MKENEWLFTENLNELAGIRHYVYLREYDNLYTPARIKEPLMELIARVAAKEGQLELLKRIVDNGFNVNANVGYQQIPVIALTSSYECQRFLIDSGALFDPVTLPLKSAQNVYGFVRSRNLARSSAILVMFTMREMDKKYKNVSVIIGRVIWESRGDSENWLNCERPFKK